MAHRPADGAGEPMVFERISVRVPDAARMTGLSRSKLYQLIASGEIEAVKVGRATVVLVASLNAFLHAHRKVPRGRP